MTNDEFKSLSECSPRPASLTMDNVPNPTKPRTLLYGYTTARFTHHVYLRHGLLHLLVYQPSAPGGKMCVLLYEHGTSIRIENLIPSKRLYPAACDYETSKFLIMAGYSLPFTTWDIPRPDTPFHGLTREEIKDE